GSCPTRRMASAREPVGTALETVEVRPPRVPVLSGATAQPFDDIRAGLVDALTTPVRWSSVLDALADAGARRFLEVGPGNVLTGLVRKTLVGVEAVSVSEMTRA